MDRNKLFSNKPLSNKTPSILACAIILLLVYCTKVNAQTLDLTETPDILAGQSTKLSDQPGVEKKDDIALSSKLGPFLSQTMLKTKRLNNLALAASPLVRIKDSRMIQVYIQLETAEDLDIEELANLGATIEIVNKDLKKVQAWLSAESFDDIESLSNVIKITTPSFGTPRAGSVNTQGDAILKANRLRELGHTGKGIRVGIVSDGASSWRSARASGDLPEKITTYGRCSKGVNDPRNCRRARTCNEGTAMAEIIHDIAPDAELAVAAVSTSLEFIQQINRLADEFKADIIVDDLGFFGEPYFEDGDIAKAVEALPSNVLYVTSAGNSANNFYTSYFTFYTSSVEEFNNTNDFSERNGVSTGDPFHGFLVAPNSGTFVILQWEDTVPSDVALNVYDSTSRLGTSDFDNIASDDRIEGLCVSNSTNSNVVRFATAKLNQGSTALILKMFFLGAPAIEYPVSRGSIFGHAAVERALTVGTINADEPGNDEIAFYSSQGPYEPYPTFSNGFSNTIMRPKPDLTGIDGVNVTGAGGFPSNFFGTSAAAPHVAGIAAQLMSVSGFVRAADAREALTLGAVDLGARGFDFIYGHGRADAEKALEALRFGNPTPAIIILLDEDES